jgi:hypothetical protein
MPCQCHSQSIIVDGTATTVMYLNAIAAIVDTPKKKAARSDLSRELPKFEITAEKKISNLRAIIFLRSRFLSRSTGSCDEESIIMDGVDVHILSSHSSLEF